MPRLTVWCLGALTAAGTSYVAYYYVYHPLLYEKPTSELAWQANIREWQSITQQAGVLRGLAAPAQAVQHNPTHSHSVSSSSLSSSSSSSSSSAASSCSAWHSNGEMIGFFCRVQRLRAAIYHARPSTHVNAAQVHALLAELRAWEQRYCQPLHFREAALTVKQWALCVLCFVAYGVFFRLLPCIWTGESLRRRRCLHRVARCITKLLNVECTLVTSAEDGADEHDDITTTSERGTTQEQQQQQLLVFAPQHWVELVGLWACNNSPLLTSTCKIGQVSAESFTDYWSQQQQEQAHRTPVHDPTGDACEELYGYPLAVHGVQTHKTSAHKQPVACSFLPVACVGLPRLLHLGPALARSDERPRVSNQAKYDAFFRAHYPLYHTDSAATSSKAEDIGSGVRTRHEDAASSQQQQQQGNDKTRYYLQRLRQTSTSSFSSYSSYVLSLYSMYYYYYLCNVACNVYGGTQRPRLTYYVGRACEPCELTRGVLEATQHAVEASLA